MKILILPKYDQSGASSDIDYITICLKENIKWYCKPLLKPIISIVFTIKEEV
jgi:hypothetical protein